MSISLAGLAQARWTVDFDTEGDLLVIVPATRETGLFANRMFFRLMNVPEGMKVSIIFYDTDFKAFRENELGYKEDDYRYGSRAYTLAKRFASDKIKTYAMVNGTEQQLIRTVEEVSGSVNIKNIIFYGLSSSNYKTHFFSIFEVLLRWKEQEWGRGLNILGVYLNGDGHGGLTCHMVNGREDALGLVNRPFDDSMQTQLTISTIMFNILNKWVSGTTLGTKTLGIDLATGEINPNN